MARRRTKRRTPTTSSHLYADDCPVKYEGPIQRADGRRPFNGYLWATEAWWAHRSDARRNWNSRWNFGIVALWNWRYAVMGELWAIEKDSRRYSWTEQAGQLHRPNNFASRSQAIRTAAADLLREVRSAQSSKAERVANDPVHYAEVVNWILETAHRQAGSPGPARRIERHPLPPGPPAKTGLPLIDLLNGHQTAPSR